MKQKQKKVIIFDETNGKSKRGKMLKNLAWLHDIPYVTDNKELKQNLGVEETEERLYQELIEEVNGLGDIL